MCRQPRQPGDAVLEILRCADKRLSGRRRLALSVRRGEILGLAGSGRRGAHRTGARHIRHRSVAWRIDSARRQGDVVQHRPREAIANGIFLVPEDRKRFGLLLDVSIAENIALPNLQGLCHGAAWSDDRRSLQRNAEQQKRTPAYPGRQCRNSMVEFAVRRQPAESRAGQMAVDATRGF